MKTGIELIAEERQKQITKHLRDAPSDAYVNSNKQLSFVAEMLLASDREEGIDSRCFPENWDKDVCHNLLSKTYQEKLVIAGSPIGCRN